MTIALAPAWTMALICWILALGIRTGDLDLEIDLVGHALMGRHGLDHVGRLRLPVVADVAHAQEDLVLAGGIGGAGKGQGSQRRQHPRCGDRQCPFQ